MHAMYLLVGRLYSLVPSLLHSPAFFFFSTVQKKAGEWRLGTKLGRLHMYTHLVETCELSTHFTLGSSSEVAIIYVCCYIIQIPYIEYVSSAHGQRTSLGGRILHAHAYPLQEVDVASYPGPSQSKAWVRG